jgi:uncharacterized membrane protein
MTTDTAVWMTIAVMAITIAATRISGAFVMGRINSNPWVERFLNSMSSSVIVAIVATAVANGGSREILAVSVAVVTVMLLRRPLLGMIAGTLGGALWRISMGV